MVRFTLFSVAAFLLSWFYGADSTAALAKSGGFGSIMNMFIPGGNSGFLDPFGETSKPKVKEPAMSAPQPQNVPAPSQKDETAAIAEAKAAEEEKAKRRRANGAEGTILTSSGEFDDESTSKKKPTKKTVLGAA